MGNVIEFQHVSKELKGFRLKDCSFQVKKGFVTGFIGENGAGKSTSIKMMLNINEPSSGSIKVLGENVTESSNYKNKIGFVFDDNVYYEHLSLLDNKKIIASMYSNWSDEAFLQYVEKFELPLKKKLKEFSKGMKMKAALALALSHDPELIIMDEPTSGLDPVSRREILEILHELMQTGEKTIFFSTHITSDLERIADYIVFIHKGEIIFQKDVEEIAKEYAIVKGSNELLDSDIEKEFISIRKTNVGFEALTNNRKAIHEIFGEEVIIENASLEEIMYFTKKKVSL